MVSEDMIKPSTKSISISKRSVAIKEESLNRAILERAYSYPDGSVPFIFEMKYGNESITSANSKSQKHIQQMMKYMLKSHGGNIKRIGVYANTNTKEILWLPEFQK
jgi:hypothetical protein